MLISLPRYCEKICLPKKVGINNAWDYLKSLAGREYVRKQFLWLTTPQPTMLRNGRQVACQVPRIGNISNNKPLGYISFSNGIFLIRYKDYVGRGQHLCFAGKNAYKFYGKTDDTEPLLEVSRFNVRDGGKSLKEVNYKIYIEL